MKSEKCFVGCCGWGYFSPKKYFSNDWKKRFVSRLQCYASLFNFIEVNSTFYNFPNEKTTSRWLEEAHAVNKRFVFALKVNKVVSHIDMFKTRDSEQSFLKSLDIARTLNSKILLIQTPSSFKPTKNNVNNLRKFLKKASEELDDERIVFEFRGDFLDHEEIIRKICEENNIEHCVDVFRNNPLFCRQFLYFRLHGFGKKIMYNYNFDYKELKLLKKRIFELKKKFKPKQIFILFNNYSMYENALEFERLLNKNH